jgi:hypothetical protein
LGVKLFFGEAVGIFWVVEIPAERSERGVYG